MMAHIKQNCMKKEQSSVEKSPAQSNIKLTFEQVIALQHNTGYWGSDKLSSFTSFFKNGVTEDASVRRALEELSGQLADTADKDTMYVTLLAIYVLSEVFAAKED